MIRRFLLFSALFVTSSAFATWNPAFSSNYEDVYVGETRTIYLRAVWSGISFFDFHRWICFSDSEDVARVDGGLTSLTDDGEVRITGVSPGTAWVQIREYGYLPSEGRFVRIEVHPRQTSVSIAASSRSTTVGRAVTLTALSDTAGLGYRWYNGHRGDESRPLQASGNELTVTPSAPGHYFFWVSAIGNHSLSIDEIEIDVAAAPRRRAVIPR